MNPFLYTLRRLLPTQSLPQVWVWESHAYNQSEARTEVTWKLSVSEALAQTLYVNIYHTSTSDGTREAWEWDIPAGQTSVEAVYHYPDANVANVTELEFGILSGSGYSIPNTAGKPQEVRVVKTTTGETGGGGQEPGTGTGTPRPDPDTLTWENRLELTGSGTFLIENRNLQSTDGWPVIDAKGLAHGSTLIVRNCYTDGGGSIVFTERQRLHVQIENCFAFSMDYDDKTGWGNWFFTGEDTLSLKVEHNDMEGRGVQASWRAEHAPNVSGVSIRYNKIRNVRGRGDLGLHANAINLQGQDADVNVANVRLAWNEIYNEEGKTDVEDNINLLRFGGTATSRLQLHDNFIYGAYNLPVSSGYATGNSYSGGGIIVEQYLKDHQTNADIFNNLLCHVQNYCIGLAGGMNVNIFNNKCIVAGMHQKPELYGTYTAGVNTSGIWAKDFNGTVPKNNKIYNNVIGVRHAAGTQTPGDDYHEELRIENNAALAYDNILWQSYNTFPTLQTEAQLYPEWQEKLADNNITLGPVQ